MPDKKIENQNTHGFVSGGDPAPVRITRQKFEAVDSQESAGLLGFGRRPPRPRARPWNERAGELRTERTREDNVEVNELW